MHAQRRPPWAADPLDAERVLFAVPEHDHASGFRDAGPVATGSGTRIRFTEGATFWIAATLDEIWLEYDPPLTAADAAYFLFEPVLGFVLRCRGVLALHASAVEIAGRAVLFCGAAGSGKSTTAAACVAAGHGLLSDDLVAVTERSGSWTAHRGTGAIRLWDDGARALGYDVGSLPRFSPTWDKRTLAVDGRSSPAVEAAPVGLLCVLDEGESRAGAPGAKRISGAAAFRDIVAHTAANRLHDAHRRAAEVGQLARFLDAVRVVRLTNARDAARIPELVRTIVAALDA